MELRRARAALPRVLVTSVFHHRSRSPTQPEPSDPKLAVEIRSSVPLQPEPLDLDAADQICRADRTVRTPTVQIGPSELERVRTVRSRSDGPD
jgi:hypothetical protein